jgi:PAS domain S-box-containing protein
MIELERNEPTLPSGTVTPQLELPDAATEMLRVELATPMLAAIVQYSEDAIIGKDLNGIVTSWNPAAERIFGFSAAEMIGTSIKRIILPDRYAEEDAILSKVRVDERVSHFETRRQRKDGTMLDVSVTTSPIKRADGRIVGASKIARDISGAKEREREIARLSRLYEALSQVNQAIVTSANRVELFQKICRALVHRAGFRMSWIGWHSPGSHSLVPMAECGDDQGYLASIRVHTDERPEGRDPTGTAFWEGRPYVCNDLLNDPATLPWRDQAKRMSFRASAAFPIREAGKVSGTLTVHADEPGYFRDKEIALIGEVAADISFALDNMARDEARREAEERLRRERDFSDAVLTNLPGVLYLHDQTGRFLRWNRNFERVTGYAADEIVTKHPLEFFGSAERPLVEGQTDDVFDNTESRMEVGLLAKNGAVTPYHFTGIRAQIGGKACLVGVGIDISERKQAEAALRESNESLELKVAARTTELQQALLLAEAADRVKSAFLATMSHELRTPLNSIIGFTGIIMQGLAGPLTDEQTKQLGMVQGSARHLLEVINDVLDLSKIEAEQLEVRLERVDLRASLEKVIASVMPIAKKKKLSLETSVPDGLAAITSDRRRVEQILLNLVNNALKFTTTGGVVVAVEPGEPEPPLASGSARDTVRIVVTDTGIGVKAEHLSKLFQPFGQLDTGIARQHEGTGLGLAICRRLTALLGGHIVAHSEWGKGSQFTVTLPREGKSS